MFEKHGPGTSIEDGRVEYGNLLSASALRAAGRAISIGDITEATESLRQAFGLPIASAPDFPATALVAAETLLQHNEVSLAERFILEGLARCQGGSKIACHAQLLLAQVYEAQWRWESAADMYGLVRDGFLQTQCFEQALLAGRRQAWALIQNGEYGRANSCLNLCATIPADNCETERHICQALAAYCCLRAGDREQASWLSVAILSEGGSSVWAMCLAAVTAGWLLLDAGVTTEAGKALSEADRLMYLASRESHSVDIINLVNQLRLAYTSPAEAGVSPFLLSRQ